jgi:hypothetical protein
VAAAGSEQGNDRPPLTMHEVVSARRCCPSDGPATHTETQPVVRHLVYGLVLCLL